MKRTIKTLLISALCICMLLAATPNLGSPVFAAEIVDSGYCGGEGDGTNLTWTLDSDGLLIISGTGEMGDYNLVTDEEANKNITTAPWGGSYANARRVKTVEIKPGVTSIGNRAFDRCTRLTEVTIGNGVTSIGDYAFTACTSLTSITIPDSVTSIGDDAFILCEKLISIAIPDSVTNIGSTAFSGCTDLASVEIGNGITTIKNGTFYDCYRLTSVTIPNSVMSIGNLAFAGCLNLTSVTIPDSVIRIGDSAFFSCTHLISITIGNGMTKIGQSAFTNCKSLKEVYYSGSQADWQNIQIDSGNDALESANIHFIDNSYSVSYNPNGGTGTPSAQTKTQNVPLTLSTLVPTKSFTISFNANGGSVSPASKTVNCTFKNWNTQQNGSGTAYAPGGSYTANADATLYAQWTNPTAGTLPTPTRDGYTFDGWYTAASGGTRVTASDTISDITALYAHWESSPNVYNLGEETYSFSNFSDSHAGGHCFGMSMTSAGYYNHWIDMDRIGGSTNTSLYSFSDTPIVRKPICYYQKKQGSYRERAMVAGGSSYRTGTNDIYSDWKAVVNYVKNHSYDNTGLLQIGFRKGEYGHAINFLRYENVNGQDRIYAYDNNFPKQETYFYRAADGNVYQAPMQTFSGAIDCICLRDISIYFSIVGDFNDSRALYVAKDTATVQGYTFSYMEGAPGGVEYVMYEIPDSVSEVTIIPKADNADFIYMDTEYSFGTVTDETYGVLTFASTDEHGVETASSFKIFEGRVPYLVGDVDADGKVTASDARLALRCAVGLENYAPGSAQFLACDVDGDKKVTASDARLILRAAVGLETLQ